jgi:hypothetical protein
LTVFFCTHPTDFLTGAIPADVDLHFDESLAVAFFASHQLEAFSEYVSKYALVCVD